MLNFPHFIIIGAMKSATTTLHQQLSMQPGIVMSSPKEPNFFSDEEQYNKGTSWYLSLFGSVPTGYLAGEASTHYTKLPFHNNCVGRLARHLPECRFIYVMRHPIDRLISHYIHEWSTGVYSCDINTAIQIYPEMIAYGEYARQLGPYIKMFGEDRILPVFFDRLFKEPQSELERVCQFIGYNRQSRWFFEDDQVNISSERIRKFPFYNLLVESSIATRFRHAFIPQEWRNRVKSKFTLKDRPVLSGENIKELEVVFDQDLAVLGEWLGLELNCSNFKEITASKELSWTKR